MSRILVFKFGERCVATPEGLNRIFKVVSERKAKGDKLTVVTAAVEGVTDGLLDLCLEAENGRIDEVKVNLGRLRERHVALASEALESTEVKRRVLAEIDSCFLELRSILEAASKLREVTGKTRDYVASFGEILSAILVAGRLRSGGVEADYLPGWKAGIVTDEKFGEADPLLENTRVQVSRILKPLLDRGVTPVVAGFSGVTLDGRITTLGRGGADYTATILAYSLGASEVWLWSHVDGVMTADPSVEPRARTVERLSFEEAVELARFGAKKLHPKVFDPVASAGIPVRIRNLFNPENPGTLIAGGEPTGGTVKTVVLIRDVALLAVEGTGMVGVPGVAARIFEALGRAGVNILMISQSSSEANITVIVDRRSVDRALSALESTVTGSLVSRVYSEPDVCVVSVVGCGMRGTPGVAARVFGAVASKGINVRMIAQGSSEYNISFVVRESDGEEAVRAIHEEFNLHRSRKL